MTCQPLRTRTMSDPARAPVQESLRGHIARLRLARAAVATCSSDLDLERYLLAPEQAPAAVHVASCDRCRRRLAEMRRLGEEFQREVYPTTLWAILQAMVARVGSPIEARPSMEHLLEHWWRPAARGGARNSGVTELGGKSAETVSLSG
jgi:hypothetical protein